MKRLENVARVLTVVCAAGLFAACPFGGGEREAGGDTPQEAFELVQKLVAEKDWSGLFDLFAESARKQLEVLHEVAEADPALVGKSAEEVAGLSLRDFAATYLAKKASENPDEFDRLAKAEVVEVRTEGSSSVVSFKSGDRTDQLRLVKVQERWFIADFQ